MARQTGIIPMTGRLGGLSFYHHKYYGMLVRQCSPVSRDRYRNDPKFARSRENNSEFGSTSTHAALLRNRLKVFLGELYTGRLDNMMMKKLSAIRKTDTVSDRGKRNLKQALALHPDALGNFDLHPAHALDWFVANVPVVEREAGKIVVSGLHLDHVPDYATHVAFAGVRIVVDFGTGVLRMAESDAVWIKLGDQEGADVVLALPELHGGQSNGADESLQCNGCTEIWGMKVQFYQEMNGERYALQVGAAKLLVSFAGVDGLMQDGGESLQYNDCAGPGSVYPMTEDGVCGDAGNENDAGNDTG